MAKTEVNSFDVRALVRELRPLLGARLDRAFQPSPGEVLLRFRFGSAETETESKKRELVVGIGKYLALTEFPRVMPEAPSGFAMTLRKHLAGARFTSVRQVGFDRVVELELSRKDATYHLVAELFGDGNLVLVKDGRIVVPLRFESWAHREVRPGAPYVPPPARFDPFVATRQDFEGRLAGSTADVVRTLATEANLGGQYAEEVCTRAEVDKTRPAADLSEAERGRLFEALRAVVERLEWGELSPVIVRRGEEQVDAAPFPLASHAGQELDEYPTFHAAVDHYFSKKVTVEREDPRAVKARGEQSKIERMLEAQKAAVVKFEEEAIAAKESGDALYANFDRVQSLSTSILAATKEQGWEAVIAKLKEAKKAGREAAATVERIEAAQARATLALPDAQGVVRKVAIDLRKSVQENAQDYYERSKKFRDKRVGAARAMELTEAKLKEVRERGAEIAESAAEAAARAPPTKRFWFETYRWFETSDGHLVLGGRDASSNEKVVKKHLEEGDRYAHADLHGAPSVVVKAKAGAVSDAAIAEGTAFAACTSKAWGAGVGAAEAYWVMPSQVSRTPNPGEFLAKGAFIVRGKRNYVRVPLEFAVGEVEVDGARKIMGGPVAALAGRSKRYVVLRPGREPLNALATRLSRAFTVRVEEVQAVMPPGDCEVVEARGLESL